MAACFPDLWETTDAAKKDNQRRGTNGYYRSFYNSRMSPSSVLVSYRPEGAGHKLRQAHFDLARIPDPEAWLTNRLGPLATFTFQDDPAAPGGASAPVARDADRLSTLALRLDASITDMLSARNAALDALSRRLAAFAPAAGARSHATHAEKETVNDVRHAAPL
jgi:putative DNA primase/helicase